MPEGLKSYLIVITFRNAFLGSVPKELSWLKLQEDYITSAKLVSNEGSEGKPTQLIIETRDIPSSVAHLILACLAISPDNPVYKIDPITKTKKPI